MARFLALDWSPRQLLVVAASIQRGNAQIERAAAWAVERGPGPENPQALGVLLRERLKEAGIAPAPVLACLARDQIILKDIRYPDVPAAEEPAIVRFQAAKELTLPPDEVVIDYLPLAAKQENGQRRALVVVANRQLVNSYRAVCQAAGLKLWSLTPRPWGTAASWRQAIRAGKLADPGEAAVALLTVTDHWGEFSVVHGADLLFARSLAAVGERESGLLGEIRRNLTVHASQSPQQLVRAVSLAAGPAQDALRERLQNSLAVAVDSFDPLAGVNAPEVSPAVRGGFAGAVGLVHELAANRSLPINLAEPKEPRPKRDPNSRRVVIAAAAVILALLVGVGWGVAEVVRRDHELAALNLVKISLDGQLAQIEDDAKRIKALGEWSDGEVVWLDELYDLTDRFPDPTSLRVTNLTGQPLPRTAKGGFAARLVLKGVTTADHQAVDALVSHLVQDQFYRVDPKVLSPNRGGIERFQFPQQFTTQFDIAKRPPSRYVRRLPPTTVPPPRRGNDEDLDLGTFNFGGEARE